MKTSKPNPDRYIKIIEWARSRYARPTGLILRVGDDDSRYVKIERLAWFRYMGDEAPFCGI